MDFLRTAVCVISISFLADCYEYSTPLELALKLRELNVAEWFIPTFVCVAMEASGLDTSNKQHNSYEDGSSTTAYGIFGLPDDFIDGEVCNISKELATDDNIADDVVCFMTLIKKHPAAIVGDFSLENCFTFWEQLPPMSLIAAESSKNLEMTTNPPSSSTTLKSSSLSKGTSELSLENCLKLQEKLSSIAENSKSPAISTASRQTPTASSLVSGGTNFVVSLPTAVFLMLITVLILVVLTALVLTLYLRRDPSKMRNRNFCDGSPLLSARYYNNRPWGGSVVGVGLSERNEL